MRTQNKTIGSIDARSIHENPVIDSIDALHTATTYIHALQLMANGLNLSYDEKEDANALLLVSIHAMDFTRQALNTLQEEVNDVRNS